MAANSPTIVAASLSDKELTAAIDKLVQHVDQGAQKMVKSFDSAVEQMKRKLNELGTTKVDFGGSADGGSSRRTRSQENETKAIKDTTAAYDNMASAMQRAAGGSKMSVIETYDMQVELLKNRLREVRQDIDIFNAAIGSGKKTQVEWGQQGLKQARQEAELLMRQITLLESKRGSLQNIMAPQGDTIKNYVQSIQKANPELALLNQQYKRGIALLQQKDVALTQVAQKTEQVQRDTVKDADATEKAAAAERKWAEDVRYRGQVAQETARKVRESLKAEAMRGGTGTIGDAATSQEEHAVKRLQKAIEDMQLAYNKMSDQERESPVGRALKQDIELAQQAMRYVSAYNKLALGIESYKGLGKGVGADSASVSSLEGFRAKLKALTEQYNKLSVEEINAGKDKGLVDKIQRTSRAIEILQKNMSRPTNIKNVLGLDERTLDEISYKIKQLQSYKQGIVLTNPNATSELRQVDHEINRLTKDMNKYMSAGKEVNNMNNALARSFNYMKNRLAFYFTVGESTAFVKNLINIRGQYELLERSIGILFDSMQTGTKIFSELNAMAIKSPFTTMELGAAAKQLSAYNIAAKDVVDTTRRLADIAAAVGVPIERLTYALGQIKSYGYLNSRDARMFANAGIPLIQNLADMYTKLEGRMVSIGDVYDRIKHKQVSFEDTLKVINEMTDEGGRFFNFQEKAADTLVVRLANLTLAWNNMMNEMGKDNTGLIHGMLGGLKTVFQNWRAIENAILGVVSAFGILKAAQITYILLMKKLGYEASVSSVLTKGLAKNLLAARDALTSALSMRATWVGALIAAIAYLGFQYWDLKKANDALNKSISDGAKENIDSINKFFDKYKKEIDSIGSAQSTDQEKMWERIRDEIEKTTKNAQQYIDILEKISNTAERVGKAKEFLEHQQAIQQEAKRMADHGMFDMGGGFANDSLAKDLQEYEKTMNSVLARYGSLEKAQKDLDDSMIAWSSGHYAVNYYNQAVVEAEEELDKFTSVLDKANLARIMGDGTDEERLANIRSFAQLIRDNFLATEEGQKISTEGQARLNKEIDYWIAQQGVSNGLINEQRAEVERNRSAWETFFSQLSADEKKSLDYLVSTGQTTTDEFKKIWNEAAERMKESSMTAYEQIQAHIADLRNTPPIVIDVIYRETKESQDEAQKDFAKRFLTPTGWGALSAEETDKEEKRLNTIYGRFNKKTGEDMVEWEKRLGQEYQDNEKKLSNYNKMLEGYNKLSDEQKKKREAQINTVTKERDLLKATQDALKEVQIWENFDFEQFKKGKKGGGDSKKDYLGEAFAKVVEVTGNMQKRFKEYKNVGVDANTALEKSTQEYGNTLEEANKTLQKYGIKNTKSGSELAKMELRDLRAYYESLLVIAKGVGNTKGVEALEKAIASLNVEISKIDYKRIVEGLNEDLGKLKDEYELSVALEAEPELGDLFLNLFDIDPNRLPSTIDEYASRVVDRLNQVIKNDNIELPHLDLTDDDLTAFKNMMYNGEISESSYNLIKENVKNIRALRKKDAEDTYKQTKALEYKLADTNGKIAIEEQKLAVLQQRLAKETREEKKKLLEYQIQDQEEAIAKLKEEILQLLPTYKALFGNIAEHSAVMTRRLALDYKKMLDDAVQNEDGTYTVTDPRSGQQATLRRKEYGQQQDKVNAELLKTESSLKKIKEAFTKGKDGEVDFWQGMELVVGEMKKLQDIVSTVGSFAEALGADRETVEIINDIATSIGGVATMAEGVGQIASGDYIGGIASVASGLFTTLSSWFDNADKRITEQVEESERSVKRLEIAYRNLEVAIEHAYGVAKYGAEQAALANQKLQLVELKRQLYLERSREEKNRDEDKIVDLRGQIADLENDIKQGIEDITNDLLGITSVGSAAEELVNSMIEAFKKGEDYMAAYEDSFEKMVDNIIMKAIVSRVVGDKIQEMWDMVDQTVKERGEPYTQKINALSEKMAENDRNIEEFERMVQNGWGAAMMEDGTMEWDLTGQLSKLYAYREQLEEMMKKAQEEYNKAIEPTPADVDVVRNLGQEWREGVKEEFEAWMKAFGIGYGEDSDKQLSSLQQGIQGVTETTAESLEAYMNGVSQQVYYHSAILEEIRDTIVGFDMDVQLASLSQILLQLQTNYVVMQAMKSMMEGWTVPSGQGIRVELMS